MPRFYLQKLVRDKLRNEYKKLGQNARYKTLSESEYADALKKKILEEVNELNPSDSKSVLSESADILQALEDLWALHGLSRNQVIQKTNEKSEERGGFSGATYVEYLDLQDDDEWVAYYRKEPKRFPESLHPAVEDLHVPTIETGEYEHYKGNRYQVLGIGLETESLEPYVIYTSLVKDMGMYWVRPYAMFTEEVEVNGVLIPRFRRIA